MSSPVIGFCGFWVLCSLCSMVIGLFGHLVMLLLGWVMWQFSFVVIDFSGHLFCDDLILLLMSSLSSLVIVCVQSFDFIVHGFCCHWLCGYSSVVFVFYGHWVIWSFGSVIMGFVIRSYGFWFLLSLTCLVHWVLWSFGFVVIKFSGQWVMRQLSCVVIGFCAHFVLSSFHFVVIELIKFSGHCVL